MEYRYSFYVNENNVESRVLVETDESLKELLEMAVASEGYNLNEKLLHACNYAHLGEAKKELDNEMWYDYNVLYVANTLYVFKRKPATSLWDRVYTGSLSEYLESE